MQAPFSYSKGDTMIPELDATDIGRQLGADGVNGVVAKAEQYCSYEASVSRSRTSPASWPSGPRLSLLAEEERP